jgi:4-amino-4-deoxy-L-arabinose transferase-like glycosyltransferase
MVFNLAFNPLNAELNPVCHLLALLGAHHIFHVRRIRVKGLISIASCLTVNWAIYLPAFTDFV